jgi:hypothetical protein
MSSAHLKNKKRAEERGSGLDIEGAMRPGWVTRCHDPIGIILCLRRRESWAEQTREAESVHFGRRAASEGIFLQAP